MTKRFEIGDHVSWDSEAGRVSGTIIAIHTTDFTLTYVHPDDDPSHHLALGR